MSLIKRLRHSKAGRNLGASMFAFISTSCFGLLSIPVAVHYLDKEEIGLWASVNAMVAYLMWMDLGVGNSTGRKIADAVVAKSPAQINIWWTATQIALWALGGLTVLVGVCLTPVFVHLFNVPGHLTDDALILFIGSILCTSLNFPLRGVPGLLTAQERFHWVPICQGIAPWMQLIVFFLMLRGGHGLVSYVYGTAAAQAFAFIYYRVLIATSPIRPRLDRAGVTKAHFKELFGFSLNVAVVGFKDTFLNTLPVLILARAAGLQTVPLYTFSSRLSGMLKSLAVRINHAFLPELINLHVAGRKELFQLKHRRSLILASAVAMAGAGLVMLGNRTVVTILAGPEYYAGDEVTAWFAVLVVVATIASTYQSLLQISGNMGKSIPFAVFNVVLVVVTASLGYRFFGMTGLAAVFALQPILYGIYGLLRGARNCRYALSDFANAGMLAAVGAVVVVVIIGQFLDSSEPLGKAWQFFGKDLLLPSLSQVVCSGVLWVVATSVAWLALRKVSRTALVQEVAGSA
ncbi:oligosaccharide flippase family protein [Haloferula rosea]|uniref:Oligosaccharide flippase family protein n=1 Tax=Haloferula rosea TaxID=490093 RepID=A0A934VG81_9BACT|nr:oligosaccharide flippase family protein [Haloferula rosea]MBK1827806.1 oligosaccharide flippase family protein [Haloferula rosea]